jgi:hypothetical protein
VTHVLLDVVLAARRADSAQVIAAAIGVKVVRGVGHRGIAAWLGRPASTVRGWLRSFIKCSHQITEWFTGLIHRDAVDAAVLWPKPVGGGMGGALQALMAYARVLGERFAATVTVAWVEAGIAASNGQLFCRRFWGGGCNTNTPLREGRPDCEGGISVYDTQVAGVFTTG